MSEYTDFLIVGGGISGLNLQWQLKKAGISSHLIDFPHKNSSTKVAAGIINPVAGKYYSLSWRAHELLPFLHTYYEQMQAELNSSFFKALKIKRVFKSASEQNQWLSKAHLDKYKGYCHFVADGLKGLNSEFGYLELSQGGWLNTQEFTAALSKQFIGEGSMSLGHFDYKALDLKNAAYKTHCFATIVFCEGAGVMNNPWFNQLPFSPNKGEILDIECPGLDCESIVIAGLFILPLGNQQFRIGSSYDHSDLSLIPSQEKKQELLSKFEALCPLEYKLLNHQVGIRPAVKDRRPLMGQHGEHKNMYLFNGLGSKGVSLAPLLAKELIDFIVDGKALHPEANLNRFS